MPYKNVKELLTAATGLPAAIEAKLPTGAPRLSTRLLNVANKMPTVPNFPVALPDLPALPAEPGLASLSGIVTDASTKQPIQGASVILSSEGVMPLTTTTNSSGRYSFNNITPGSYQMTLSKNGYETGVTMITLHEGSNELNIQLTAVYVPPAVATLTGVVTDASTGAALSGVKVTIAGVSAYTDANGQYGFTGITPGSYAVVFEKSGYNTLAL